MLRRSITTYLSFAALVAALALSLASVVPVAAQEATLSLAAYEQALREAHAAAERGDRISLELVAPRLIAATAVALPGGGSAPADNRWLAEELARPEPRLPLIAARLGALIDTLSSAGPSPPDDALERLEEILSRPPFARAEPQPREPGPLDQFFERLGHLLDGLVDPIGEAAGPSATVAGWMLLAAGAALVIAVLWLWLRGLRRTLRVETRLDARPDVTTRTAAEARDRADELARQGNYREAVRVLALAALLWLDERGRLRYEPHQTNREHLARLRDQPPLYERLAPVVETADRVWYGGAPIDDRGYAEYARRVSELRERASDAA
ncbi:MAG: DUF4129 domain-containing protein [Oscillochloridaceae bacterium]|nr:DUF4129 domain-containing protein [Chloroflexaceae bacterium]MDW8391401.1 DUF4129 domain-containing protein [Oscillochloridaceae bacterium]